MKKILPYLVSICAAILSALLIYFRAHLGDTTTVKIIAQVGIPFILALALAWFPGTSKQKFFNLTFGMLVYFIALSFAEPYAFEYWVKQTTPAGSAYSRYDMDALYPWLGWIFCGLAWAVGMLIAVMRDYKVLRMRKHN